MRKSFICQVVQVRDKIKPEPQSGDYMFFVNQRKTQIKLLFFELSRHCTWTKQLEQGPFPAKSNADGQCALSTGG